MALILCLSRDIVVSALSFSTSCLLQLSNVNERTQNQSFCDVQILLHAAKTTEI